MGMTRVTSPKAFPETMLFRADSGRYIRVFRETAERTPSYYVLMLQAFEVDENDNLLDAPNGNASRSSKSPCTIMRTNFTAKFQTLQPGFIKVIPPMGEVYNDETLPEETQVVDALPETASDGETFWISSQDQLYRYDGIGELERLMRSHAETAENAWLSFAAEAEELL